MPATGEEEAMEEEEATVLMEPRDLPDGPTRLLVEAEE